MGKFYSGDPPPTDVLTSHVLTPLGSAAFEDRQGYVSHLDQSGKLQFNRGRGILL